MSDTDSPRSWMGVLAVFCKTLEEQVLSEGGQVADMMMLGKERMKPSIRQLARSLIVQSGRVDWFSLSSSPISLLDSIETGGYHCRLGFANLPNNVAKIPVAVHLVHACLGFQRLQKESTVLNLFETCHMADLVEFLELGRVHPRILREYLPAETFFQGPRGGYWHAGVMETSTGHLELNIDTVGPISRLATGFYLLVHKPR